MSHRLLRSVTNPQARLLVRLAKGHTITTCQCGECFVYDDGPRAAGKPTVQALLAKDLIRPAEPLSADDETPTFIITETGRATVASPP